METYIKEDNKFIDYIIKEYSTKSLNYPFPKEILIDNLTKLDDILNLGYISKSLNFVKKFNVELDLIDLNRISLNIKKSIIKRLKKIEKTGLIKLYFNPINIIEDEYFSFYISTFNFKKAKKDFNEKTLLDDNFPYSLISFILSLTYSETNIFYLDINPI